MSTSARRDDLSTRRHYMLTSNVPSLPPHERAHRRDHHRKRREPSTPGQYAADGELPAPTPSRGVYLGRYVRSSVTLERSRLARAEHEAQHSACALGQVAS